MHFDYLRSERRHRMCSILTLRPPRDLQVPLVAAATAACILLGTVTIERYRSTQTREIVEQYRAQYQDSQIALRRVNVYEQDVRAVVRLDADARLIRRSGVADARCLGDIAQHLPAHAWLTAIRRDSTGIQLDGRATAFEHVASIMRELSTGAVVGQPVLVGAARLADRGPARTVTFTIHVMTKCLTA